LAEVGLTKRANFAWFVQLFACLLLFVCVFCGWFIGGDIGYWQITFFCKLRLFFVFSLFFQSPLERSAQDRWCRSRSSTEEQAVKTASN